MLILISCLIFFITSVALIVLRIAQPNARYAWLVAAGGAVLAFLSVFAWVGQTPFTLIMPSWKPETLFIAPVTFEANSNTWVLSLSLAALALANLLTAVARPVTTNSSAWAGVLALGGIGILAVTAGNSLTLLLIWGLFDITELIIQLRSVDGPANNEKVVIAFSTRAGGVGLLLWAVVLGNLDFGSASSGLFLAAAVGLRLGVFPLHLPYSADSKLRRGFGTSLRLTSATSSLALLLHIPPNSAFASWMIAFACFAAIFGGWMWLRSPDELSARPYWAIGMAALAMISALSGSSLGVAAWGSVMILTGGAIFLSSIQNIWLNRLMLAGAWSLSTLPFSLSAGAWTGSLGFFFPFAIAAQALISAGFIRHALRPSGKDSLESQPNWTRVVYPSGIILLIGFGFLLGLIGWDGALQIGAWLAAIFASLLTIGLVWAMPRFRIFSATRAVQVSSLQSTGGYQWLWGPYRFLGQLTDSINAALEGESGIMWTLLFLALFVSALAQGG